MARVKWSYSRDHGHLLGLDDGDHDAVYYTETELGATTQGHTSGADLIGIPILNDATNKTVHEFINLFGSAGRATGGAVTAGVGETVDVAEGTGFIKALDEDDAELMSCDWVAAASQAITTDSVRYVGIEYVDADNSPVVVVREAEDWDLDTDFPLAKVINDGGSIHILCNPWWVTDGLTNIIERFQAQGHLVRDEHLGGLMISVAGTRTLGVTAGTLWSRLNEFAISALETNTPLVASHSATFVVAGARTITAGSGTPYSVLAAGQKIYINGTTDNDGYVKVVSVNNSGADITVDRDMEGANGVEPTTILSPTFELYSYTSSSWGDANVMQYPVTHWNDLTANGGAGGLTALDNNKFMNMWVYAEADDDEIAMVYGQAFYNTSAAAEAEGPPSTISTHHSESAKLLGRILIKKSVDAPVQIDTVFSTTFTASQAADHGNLAGLDTGADHSYIDQDVTNGSSPTFNAVTGTTFVASGAETYAVTNAGTDRTYDANATSINELADILGTLIADLQALGLITS